MSYSIVLEWVKEYAVRAYTTPGSVVAHLDHALVADYTVVSFMTHDCSRIVVNGQTTASAFHKVV